MRQLNDYGFFDIDAQNTERIQVTRTTCSQLPRLTQALSITVYNMHWIDDNKLCGFQSNYLHIACLSL